MQKILAIGNKLPQYDVFESFQTPETSKLQKETSSELKNLIHDLVDYRIDLFNRNSSVAPTETPLKRKATDEESLEDLWEYIHKLDTDFKATRYQILDKWCDKIKVASGSSAKLKAVNTNTSVQIQNILADMDRLVKRTQLLRSEYSILGKSCILGEQYDTEIFDDEDFYAILLKEFIESKASDDGGL